MTYLTNGRSFFDADISNNKAVEMLEQAAEKEGDKIKALELFANNTEVFSKLCRNGLTAGWLIDAIETMVKDTAKMDKCPYCSNAMRKSETPRSIKAEIEAHTDNCCVKELVIKVVEYKSDFYEEEYMEI